MANDLSSGKSTGLSDYNKFSSSNPNFPKTTVRIRNKDNTFKTFKASIQMPLLIQKPVLFLFYINV